MNVSQLHGIKKMKAYWWIENNKTVSCNLCFRKCTIEPGNSGKCGVRHNENGTLVSSWLGRFCAAAVDPVEKKPLFHWKSGSFIYSLGSIGCTMDCPFCPNHRIARPSRKLNPASIPYISTYELVRKIKGLGLNSVALTYNEPSLQAEYICKAAPVLHDNGIDITLVTNGVMSHESATDLLSCLKETDAANIDVKAFNPEKYSKLGGNLETMKNNVRLFAEAGVHIELTNLVVPALNDDVEEFTAMVNWIASISHEMPLHITRYFPARVYTEPPTDISILNSFASIAREKLKSVHIGNV